MEKQLTSKPNRYHVGKWHLNRDLTDTLVPQPQDHGFDYSFGTSGTAYPTHENPVIFHRNGQPVGPPKGYACLLVVDGAGILPLLKGEPLRRETPLY